MPRRSRHRQRRRRWTIPALMALLVAAVPACSGDGEAVTVFGPETGAELRRLEEAFATFTEDTGIPVEVEGSEHFEKEIGGRVAAGDAPDITMFPQPGKLREFRDEIPPLPPEVVERTGQNFDPGFTEHVTFEDELKAVPVKADLKGIVWYSPAEFDAAGYEVPETFEEFLDLVDQMLTDGRRPFCIGIESGEASGWPMTDWIEDWMLRLKGPDLYDQWAEHEIPFNDPRVVEVGQAVYDLWSRDGFIYGGLEAAAGTNVDYGGRPVLTDECMMYRYANFYAVQWPEDVELVLPKDADGDISGFLLPGSEENPDVALSGALYAAAFSDDEDVTRVMEFIASPEFADAQASYPRGGFLSPNRNVDASLYPNDLTRAFHDQLTDQDTEVKFDASDLMPGPVGTGTFWTAVVDIVAGSKDVAAAFADVEESWPARG